MGHITLYEFQSLGWTKKTREKVSRGKREKEGCVCMCDSFFSFSFFFLFQLSPGITFMTSWFNQCSFGLAHAILSLSSSEIRGAAIQKVIETAVECEKVSYWARERGVFILFNFIFGQLNNFNSLMTLLSTLSQASISRLKVSFLF